MKQVADAFLIPNIKAPFDAPEAEILRIAELKMKRACSSAAGLHFRLYKKSLDARKKTDIRQVCTVLCTPHEPMAVDEGQLSRCGIQPHRQAAPAVIVGDAPLFAPPLVVGMGPAGLFAGLLLAEWGYAPIIIDRGDAVAARAVATERFRLLGALDTESNIQFGAGGAGTFSDGKLVTRVKDPFCNYVLETMVKHGAPADILVKAKPHVGTDVLRQVVDSILARIAALGGRVLYRTKLTDFSQTGDGLLVKTSAGTMRAGAMILAIGHSARDTFSLLMQKGLQMESKPFSVGLRIEHLREDIDRALFGDLAGHPALGPGEYALSDTTGPRGVYTFCMCPGGEVVTAASEEGGVVVNGMSYHARDGKNSNAALAVTVDPADVGDIPAAIAFQRQLEQAAFAAAGGTYAAPAETVGDFLGDFRGTAPTRIAPTYGGGRVEIRDLKKILPPFISAGLAAGLLSFDRKIAGFATPDGILTGVETRTSSPLRMLRSEARTAPFFDRIYPAGEGAGYAGGITSAALDGLRSALALMARFAPAGRGSEQ